MRPIVRAGGWGDHGRLPTRRASASSPNVRMGKPLRPDVAAAFDRMAAAARREAGLYLSVSSGFRSDAEQAVLWNAKPTPHLFLAPRARSTASHPLSSRPTGAELGRWGVHCRFEALAGARPVAAPFGSAASISSWWTS
ncbi:MAG: D-alanyl-D-alanine carboxypeptidase family protein [Actinomycetota bacterium]|nr:D-alanyl-D-alanine carboxypeptidase family protein [Actinomycetota bacterium]